MLAVINKYLAPGAFLIVTVPSGPMNEFEKSIGHRKHYRSSELVDMLRSVDLDVAEVCRAGFPFFNLYKITALLRGNKIKNDVAADKISTLIKVCFKVFDFLFKFNLTKSFFGWQLLIIAQKKK